MIGIVAISGCNEESSLNTLKIGNDEVETENSNEASQPIEADTEIRIENKVEKKKTSSCFKDIVDRSKYVNCISNIAVTNNNPDDCPEMGAQTALEELDIANCLDKIGRTNNNVEACRSSRAYDPNPFSLLPNSCLKQVAISTHNPAVCDVIISDLLQSYEDYRNLREIDRDWYERFYGISGEELEEKFREDYEEEQAEIHRVYDHEVEICKNSIVQ